MTELSGVLLRFRWRFILPAFVVTSLVLSCGLLIPRKYKAVAIFERKTDLALDEMSRRGGTRQIHTGRKSTIEQIAGAPAITDVVNTLAPALKEMGYATTRDDLHQLAGSLRRGVLVKFDVASRELDRVRIEYIGDNAPVGELVVNALTNRYIAQQRDAMTQQLRETARFFSTEVNRCRAEIEGLENQILEFEIKHAELLPDHPNSIQMQILTARNRMEEITTQRDTLAIRAKALRDQINAEPLTLPAVTMSRNPELVRKELQLRQMREELQRFTGILKMRERHPDVIALRDQIKSLEQDMATLDSEVVSSKQFAPNAKRAQLDMQLTATNSEYKALQEGLTAEERTIAKLSESANEMYPVRSSYNKLNRSVDQARRQLAFWEDNLNRMEMALTAENGDKGVQLNFIHPARANMVPVSPAFAQVCMAAIALGGMAGALCVFLAFRNDSSVEDAAELEQLLDLQVLGAVSELITDQQIRLRRLRNFVIYPINGAIMASVLMGLATLLFLTLERPETLDRLKSGPSGQQSADDNSKTTQSVTAYADAIDWSIPRQQISQAD